MKRFLSRGLTLIEVMVVSAIVAIMAAMAAPSMQAFIRGMQLRTTATDLSTALAYARAEAIKRGWPVTVCKSSTTGSGSPVCSTTANWQDGWLVFVDHNGGGTITTAAAAALPADILLRTRAMATSGLTITGGANFADYVTYGVTGTSRGSGGLNNGTLTVCHGGESKAIVINTTGRASIQDGSC